MHGQLLPVQQPAEQGGRAPPGVGHVDVRVGPVGDHRIGRLEHQRGHVGVQVQADRDGHPGPHRGADPAQDLAVPVVVRGGHHGAVQVQVDRVRPVLAAGVDDLPADPLEGTVGHRRRGGGRAPQHRAELGAPGPGLPDEPADRDVDIGQPQHLRAAVHPREALAVDEVLVVGRCRGEGVRLVQEPGDQDLRRHRRLSTRFLRRPCVSPRPRGAGEPRRDRALRRRPGGG